jgi:hypothetical protein
MLKTRKIERGGDSGLFEASWHARVEKRGERVLAWCTTLRKRGGGGGSVARRTPERGPRRPAMVGHGGGGSQLVRQVTGGGPVRGHRCTGRPEKEKEKMGSAQ